MITLLTTMTLFVLTLTLGFILGMVVYHNRRLYRMDLYISLMALKFGNIKGFTRSFKNYLFSK